MQEWVATLSNAGKAPATVVKAHQKLAKVMRAAVRHGLIKSSPCTGVTLPKIERKEMRFLSPTEITRLADAMDPRYRALVLVSCYGGLRIGELAALRRGRVAILGKTARVEVAETADETKGELTYCPPKTKASRRTVQLPPSVASVLARHMARLTDADPNAFVFPAPGVPRTSDGGLRVHSWRRRFWLPSVKAAGLVGLRPHDYADLRVMPTQPDAA